MTKEYKNMQSTEEYLVNEPVIAYQHQTDRKSAITMITQDELDETCISLEESKKRIIEKIHYHFIESHRNKIQSNIFY